MSIVNPELKTYLTEHSQQEPDLLRKLREETEQKHRSPHMISGAYQGRFLSMISKMIKPKKILEIGTYTGYSALCLAEGLPEKGLLTTIDKNPAVANIAQRYFQQSTYKHQILQIVGNALEIVADLNNDFDLIFIDADKKNYVNYFKILLHKMNPNAILLSDNVLWKGKVYKKNKDSDEYANAIDDYNKLLTTHPKIENIILPIRDGISISRIKE